MKTNIKDRIRLYLKTIKMPVSAFEKSILASNGYVNSIVNGIGAEKLEKILELHPKLNSKWLLHGEGEMLLPDIPDNIDDTINQKEITTKNGLTYIETESGEYIVTVDLVPFEAHARYVSDDVEEFAEWEKITFKVAKIGKGKYLGFKHKGESMFNPDSPGYYDTQNKDVSLGRELGRQHWQDGFNPKKAPYGWILITNKNILHKDIIGMDKDTGDIICHSRNPSPEYSDFTINLNDVYQIFKIITVNHNSNLN